MARTKSVPVKVIHGKNGKKKDTVGKLAVPEPGGVKKKKAARRYKPGTVAMRDIRHAQRHGNRGIPKSVIDSLVREIAGNSTEGNTQMRFKKGAMRTLHEAAEGFQTDLLRLGGTLSLHAKRKTLDEKSLKLASTLMLCPHVFYEPQGTAKAMMGIMGNQTKHDWSRVSYPKDADSVDDKHVAKKEAKKAAKSAKKQAAAVNQANAENAADEDPDKQASEGETPTKDVDEDEDDKQTDQATDLIADDGFMSADE